MPFYIFHLVFAPVCYQFETFFTFDLQSPHTLTLIVSMSSLLSRRVFYYGALIHQQPEREGERVRKGRNEGN